MAVTTESILKGTKVRNLYNDFPKHETSYIFLKNESCDQ